MSDNRRVARALIARGIPTAPASATDKTPLTPHGFHDRTTDARQVEAWAARWPGCLWLLVPADIGALVFDVDSLTSHAIFARLALADRRTYFTETPGGVHVAFRNVAGLTGGRPLSLEDVGLPGPPPGGKPADRLVVRIDRGYVIAPGCMRADGGRYVAHGRFADLAPLPDAVAWVLHHAGGKERPREGGADAGARTAAAGDPNESVIAAFNRAHTVAELLERNEYRKCGKRWIAPTSKSGVPGVVVLDGKAYSHHATDVLADFHAHDAFDVFALLEHRGDVRAAVRAAAESLGIEHKRPPVESNPSPEPATVRVMTRRTYRPRASAWRASLDANQARRQ